MEKYNKKYRKELLEKVEKAQKYLKHKGVKEAKINFLDSYYGAVYKKEAQRLDNLWAKKIICPFFTEKLERFCLMPVRNLKHQNQSYSDFERFVDWYSKISKTKLSNEEKEQIRQKFLIKIK